MAKLTPAERANLPDRAFAYVDSKGRRRLPVHDASHVRNALARFNQVQFEDDDARERARLRLLRAAKKHGIVPVGFITGQLEAERSYVPAGLPTGLVTLLLTDIEDSTGILARLGGQYATLLREVRSVLRKAVRAEGGRQVDVRADEYFAAFEEPAAAIEAALAARRELAARSWPGGERPRLRAGIHSGTPTLTDAGYIGLSVHTAARVCAAADGGQILVSEGTHDALDRPPDGVTLRRLGPVRLKGLAAPEVLYEVEAAGLPPS